MGSLWFAKARNLAPAPAIPEHGIAAGHTPVLPSERSRPQRLAHTLRTTDGLPMTSHVECVALLVKSDSGLR